MQNNPIMTIEEYAKREYVTVSFRTKKGTVRQDTISLPSRFHDFVKRDEPFKFKTSTGKMLIGLVDMPGEGYWAGSTQEEYYELLEVSKLKLAEIQEQQEIDDREEEYTFEKHKPRVDWNYKHVPDDPHCHVQIIYNATETNRRRH